MNLVPQIYDLRSLIVVIRMKHDVIGDKIHMDGMSLPEVGMHQGILAKEI